MQANRRFFIRRVLAAAAATTALGTEVFALQPGQSQQRERFLNELLMGMKINDFFYGHWQIINAYPPLAGAVILHIQSPQRTLLRVDICQKGQKTLGPAHTKHLEFFVMDGGEGKAEYTTDMKQALQYLADLLEKNAATYQLSEQLFTHTERLKYFPDAMAKAAKELVPTIIT